MLKKTGKASPAESILLLTVGSDTFAPLQRHLAAADVTTATLGAGDLASGVKTALSRYADASLLLPVLRPATQLASALAAGEPAAQALQNWCDDAQAILQLVRANRRRLILLDATAAAATPASMSIVLGAWLGVDLTIRPDHHSASQQASGILESLAAALICADPQARTMADELEALTLLPEAQAEQRGDAEISTLADTCNLVLGIAQQLDQNPAHLTPDMIAQNLQNGAAQPADTNLAQSVKSRIGDELEVTQQKLHVLHEELTTLRADQALETERDLLRDTLELMMYELSQQVLRTEEETAKIAQKATDLMLAKSQQEATERQLEAQKTRSALREEVLGARVLSVMQRVEETEKELRQLHASHSWSMTKPLRYISDSLRGGKS